MRNLLCEKISDSRDIRKPYYSIVKKDGTKREQPRTESNNKISEQKQENSKENSEKTDKILREQVKTIPVSNQQNNIEEQIANLEEMFESAAGNIEKQADILEEMLDLYYKAYVLSPDKNAKFGKEYIDTIPLYETYKRSESPDYILTNDLKGKEKKILAGLSKRKPEGKTIAKKQ